MTAHTLPPAALASELASRVNLSPDELIAGPCALPVAPLAMPHQVIEHDRGLVRRLLAGMLPPAAPTPGTGH
ncbi:hypothetical protein [Rhodobacter lacus]|uniref:Uncharacterized protein n=1 Tax=Rhodobacter lacus TaxID=1641972 RepID=A0ABW5A5I9_9RHOB